MGSHLKKESLHNFEFIHNIKSYDLYKNHCGTPSKINGKQLPQKEKELVLLPQLAIRYDYKGGLTTIEEQTV